MAFYCLFHLLSVTGKFPKFTVSKRPVNGKCINDNMTNLDNSKMRITTTESVVVIQKLLKHKNLNFKVIKREVITNISRCK